MEYLVYVGEEFFICASRASTVMDFACEKLEAHFKARIVESVRIKVGQVDS